MRYIRATLFCIILFVTNIITAQWIPTDGPYGYINVLDVKKKNGILFAATDCGVVSKGASDAHWQRISYDRTTNLCVNGDSIFTSYYHGLGVIDVNDPALEEFRHPFAGFPWANGSELAIKDSVMFIASYSRVSISLNRADWGDTAVPYVSGMDTDTSIYSGNDTVYRINTTGIITTPQYVFCSSEKGVYRSDYGLNGWQPKNSGLYDTNYRGIYSYNGNIYTSSTDSLYVSSDDGDNWSAIFGSDVWLRDFAGFNNKLHVAVDTLGVFVSYDDGVSWSTMNSGIQGKTVSGIEATGGDLYCTIEGEGIYKWNGIQWVAETTANMYCTNLNAMATTSKNVYASGWSGLHRLKQDDSWEEIFPTQDSGWFFGAVQSFGDTLMIPGFYYDGIGLSDSMAFYYSVDSANSWQTLPTPTFFYGYNPEGIELRYFNGILYAFNSEEVFKSANWGQSWQDITPSNLSCYEINDLAYFDNHLYLSNCIQGRVLRFNNNSQSWQTLNYGVISSYDTGSFIKRDTAFFVQSYDKVFRRFKNFSAWKQASNGWPVGEAKGYVNANQNLFVATSGGVMRTDDYGDNWYSFTDSLPKVWPVDIGVSEDTLYLATQDHGVYKHALPPKPVSLEEVKSIENLKIYPNPAQDYLIITPKAADTGRLSIFDVSGQLVVNQKFTSGEPIDISGFNPGVYIVSIQWQDQQQRVKLVVE